MTKATAKSPWVVHVNCNSCNGCDIEFLACLTPMYDAERFGVVHIGSPKHADIMVVTGSVNHRNARVLRNLYEQMPGPRVVVAMGVCPATGGIFSGCYNILGGIDKVVPVDVYVPVKPVMKLKIVRPAPAPAPVPAQEPAKTAEQAVAK